MKDLCYVCLYKNYLAVFDILSDKAVAQLVRGMLRYAETGEEPKLTDTAKAVWVTLKFQIDHDKKKYVEKCKANRQNGKKGGRPKKVSEEENLTVPEETEGFIFLPK